MAFPLNISALETLDIGRKDRLAKIVISEF
jgi:hypothetical protein